MRLRSDALAGAALLGLPVLGVLDGPAVANWANTAMAGLGLVLLVWVLRRR